mmetsp:Transcript_104776/g.337833  ORF Transcript_104776/g.337833 Transcript_104776/m.337833 type:complete len:209 (+) Transcript_104776:489-1115(+)
MLRLLACLGARRWALPPPPALLVLLLLLQELRAALLQRLQAAQRLLVLVLVVARVAEVHHRALQLLAREGVPEQVPGRRRGRGIGRRGRARGSRWHVGLASRVASPALHPLRHGDRWAWRACASNRFRVQLELLGLKPLGELRVHLRLLPELHAWGAVRLETAMLAELAHGARKRHGPRRQSPRHPGIRGPRAGRVAPRPCGLEPTVA